MMLVQEPQRLPFAGLHYQLEVGRHQVQLMIELRLFYP